MRSGATGSVSAGPPTASDAVADALCDVGAIDDSGGRTAPPQRTDNRPPPIAERSEAQ